MCYTIPWTWGCSSVGRALASHVRGQGFESPHLHQTSNRSFCYGCLFIKRDSNPERAKNVIKICRWQVFSFFGAQTGTEMQSIWVVKHERRACGLSPHLHQTNNRSFCYGCLFIKRDSNPKRAKNVIKICRWQADG